MRKVVVKRVVGSGRSKPNKKIGDKGGTERCGAMAMMRKRTDREPIIASRSSGRSSIAVWQGHRMRRQPETARVGEDLSRVSGQCFVMATAQ